ncbi:MAG TPA: hypothetical protein VGL10_09110 [Gammaproteobacteria bacterium]
MSSKKPFAVFFLLMGMFVGRAGAVTVNAPYEEHFEATGYPTHLSNGATHVFQVDGGWQGSGAAKFTPPINGPADAQGYSGVGIHEVDHPEGDPPFRLNVRLLIYFGSRYTIDSSVEGNKFLIFGRSFAAGEQPEDAGPLRSIVTFHSFLENSWEVAICNNIDCVYPDPRFNIAEHLEQWVSFEFQLDALPSCEFSMYVTTEDGAFNNYELQSPQACNTPDGSPLGTPAGYWRGFEVLGGFYNGRANADRNNYFKIDELVIDTDRSELIGPPEGFIQLAPSPPQNLR